MNDIKEIYSDLFKDPEYNQHEDSEYRFQFVKNFVTNHNITSVIDIGSGRGNIIRILQSNNPDIEIMSCDLKKYHDYDCNFLEIDLSNKESLDKLRGKRYDLLVCLDVLEHVEKKDVGDIFEAFRSISEYSVFTIANHPDQQNGIDVHLIQEDMGYWKPEIEQHFDILEFHEHYEGRLYILCLKNKK